MRLPNHQFKGVCVEWDCPMRFFCHCGCGEKTTISEQSHWKRETVIGEPRIWVHGHWAHVYSMPNPGRRYTVNGVDVERLQPILRELVRLVGSQSMAAILTDTSESWVSLVLNGGISHTKPEYAQRVCAELLAVRARRIAPWDQPRSIGPRPPMPEERRLAEREEIEARRRRDAMLTRRSRAGLSKPRAKPAVVTKIPTCERCGDEIQKRSDHTARWLQRRYCSRACQVQAQSGRPRDVAS